MKTVTRIFSFIICILVCTAPAFSQEHILSEEQQAVIDDELRWMQEETVVITATKTLEKVEKSGSSITVISSRDIRNMGARNLMDVLRTVPGIGVTYNLVGASEIESRGIKTPFSEKVLFLVNSHPVNNNLVNGGALWSYDDIYSVENIKQVEVIRGPGSALYGANAFTAIINIITKDAKDIDGIKLSAAGGDYSTQKYNILFGKVFNNFEIAGNINMLDTDGFKGYVESDTLTLIDPATSLAPGDTDLWKEIYDFDLKMKYNDFSFLGKYIKKESGPYMGFGHSLNDETIQELNDFFTELSYSNDFSTTFSITAKIYHDYFDADNYWEVFPEGFAGNLYPDGYVTISRVKNTKSGGELQFTYALNEKNKFVTGLTYEHQKQSGVEQEANYNPTLSPFDPASNLGTLQDISDKWNFNGPASRDIYAAYIQDIWDIRDNLRFILGARYDYYDDFGSTFNPRTAIIWEFIKDYNIKILYGSAFRAPTFGELYNKNNPTIVGNSEVEPEKIQTYEAGLGGKITDHISFQVTGFYEKIEDIVGPSATSTATNEYGNVGEMESKGVELEVKASFKGGSYIGANYTYTDAENELTGETLADVPEHRANIMANICFSKYINFYADWFLKGKTSRYAGDNREDVPGYGIVNTTLTAGKFLQGYEGLELSASIYNLFDKEYHDPSPVGSMLSDYPKPGRNFMVEMSYEF